MACHKQHNMVLLSGNMCSKQQIANGVNYAPKSSSWVMRLIIKLVPRFQCYWTTIGNTIYYPDYIKDPFDPIHEDTRAHEQVHIKQQSKMPLVLWLALYCLFPLPVGFAWFRWKMEREAYLVNIINHRYDVNSVVNTLWSYGWIWPKRMMRTWFKRNCQK
jgi:hypothetical protein